jgi:hypothetical protein
VSNGKIHLWSLPVMLTCVAGKKPKRQSSGCKLLYFLIGVKWHGKGRRFDPDQVHHIAVFVGHCDSAFSIEKEYAWLR